jgi:hypothetical protein
MTQAKLDPSLLTSSYLMSKSGDRREIIKLDEKVSKNKCIPCSYVVSHLATLLPSGFLIKTPR